MFPASPVNSSSQSQIRSLRREKGSPDVPSVGLELVTDGEVAFVKVEERYMFAFGDKNTDEERAGLRRCISS